MSNNIDFQEIWNNQKIIVPNETDFKKSLSSFNRKNIRTILIVNVLFVITSVLIISIWIYFQPKLITTKIGIVLVILAMLIYAITLNKTIGLYKENLSLNNSQFLQQLIEIKSKQKFLQTKMLTLYFILLSLGLGLYLIEYAQLMSKISGLITYSSTIIWIAFNWFYLKPKFINKQNLKLNKLIENLEKVNNQFDN